MAGGCFWCLDAVYRTLRGVSEVISGYTGGHTQNPTYEQVTTGTTGHAEAVKVVYDPLVIPTEVILNVFFTLHDPTQLNRQGADIGTQYRSAMFYDSEKQREQMEEARARAATWWPGDIVTQIVPVTEFYSAEDYHQNFFEKNPGQGYCLAVAVPKVNKIRATFSDYIV